MHRSLDFNLELRKFLDRFRFISKNIVLIGSSPYYIDKILDYNATENTDHDLSFIIYRILHCKTSPKVLQKSNSFSYLESDFVTALSSANKGVGCWESNWIIKKILTDVVLLSKNDLCIIANHDEIQSQRPIMVGMSVKVKIPKELREMNNGYYYAMSNMPIKESSDQLIRIYWNVNPSGCSILMSEVTTRLNNLAIPFHFKILNDLMSYPRTDAAVLYFEKNHYDDVINELCIIHSLIKSHLNNDKSIFTKHLKNGMAISEEPKRYESFGLNRSKAIAIALIESYERSHSKKEILNNISRHFHNAEIDFAYPYLNKGSTDQYFLNNNLDDD